MPADVVRRAQLDIKAKQTRAKVRRQSSKISSLGLLHDSTTPGAAHGPSAISGFKNESSEEIDPLIISLTHDTEVFENNSHREYLQAENHGDALTILASSRNHKTWGRLTGSLLKTSNWSRLGDLAKTLSSLPDDVAAMFEANAKKENVTSLDETTQLTFYKEFIRTALGATVIHVSEVRHAKTATQHPTHHPPPTTRRQAPPPATPSASSLRFSFLPARPPV
jgi:hypothetical protein